MSSQRKPRTSRVRYDEQIEQSPADTAVNSPHPHVIATNTGVRLACTLAAMMGLFGAFLAWTEKESRVIRRYAVQSASLTAVHLGMGMGLLLIGMLCGSVPYLGLLVSLICWLMYVAMLIILVYLRIKLMENAWHGRGYALPLLERMIRRYY